MRVLITGGGGFIGSHAVVETLEARDEHFTGFSKENRFFRKHVFSKILKLPMKLLQLV